MEFIQEAYEALVKQLKTDQAETNRKHDARLNEYLEAEEILMNFIAKNHGKSTLMELAKAIDEKHGTKDNYTQMVDCEYS